MKLYQLIALIFGLVFFGGIGAIWAHKLDRDTKRTIAACHFWLENRRWPDGPKN